MVMSEIEIQSVVKRMDFLKANPQVFDVYRFISNLYQLFDGDLPGTIQTHIQKLIQLTGSAHLRHAFEHGYFKRNYQIQNGTYGRVSSKESVRGTSVCNDAKIRHRQSTTLWGAVEKSSPEKINGGG